MPIRIAEVPVIEETDELAGLPAEDLIEDVPKDELDELTEVNPPKTPAGARTAVQSPSVQQRTPKPTAKDARISAAEDRMGVYYRSSPRKVVSASPSRLRAYYLWHDNGDLQPDSIARLLRDPPLKTNTVVTYILDAIVAEKLPYDKSRLHQELLSLLQPSALGMSKYRSLAQGHQAS